MLSETLSETDWIDEREPSGRPQRSLLTNLFVPVLQGLLELAHEFAGVGAVDEAMIEAWGESSLPDLFQAELAIVLPDNPIALAGGVFKFHAVHDLHCATGVLDDLLPL